MMADLDLRRRFYRTQPRIRETTVILVKDLFKPNNYKLDLIQFKENQITQTIGVHYG